MKYQTKKKDKIPYKRMIIWGFAVGLSISFFNPFIVVAWIGILFFKMGNYFSSSENRPEKSDYDFHKNTNSSGFGGV